MAKPQKLELTWIGKDEQPRLEPRILIEDRERSYGHTPDPSQEGNAEEPELHPETKTALIKPKRSTRKMPLFGEDDES